MTNRTQLGRLSRLDNLRDYWADEARDFTPWLASDENIELISEAIDIQLEVESVEKGVGPFRADILCKDIRTGSYVLIENQLERTDHSHLGQLMTYAAGLDAVTIVWIAKRITEEHRAALDWLNKITSDDFGFFGLEIELWQIGDSPVAPKFNIVSKPNTFSDIVQTVAHDVGSGVFAETKKLRFEYWTEFKQFMEERGSPLRVGKPSYDSWSNFAVGRANFTLRAVVALRESWIEVHLSVTGPHGKPRYHQMKAEHKVVIEQALGEVEWRDLPDAKESQIRVRRPADLSNRDNWNESRQWLAYTLERWNETLRPIVRILNAVDYGSEQELQEDTEVI